MRDLMTLCQKNLCHDQEIQKTVHNKGVIGGNILLRVLRALVLRDALVAS